MGGRALRLRTSNDRTRQQAEPPQATQPNYNKDGLDEQTSHQPEDQTEHSQPDAPQKQSDTPKASNTKAHVTQAISQTTLDTTKQTEQ